MGSKEIITLMRLLEMSESQYTVGTFSFSNGFESATDVNLIANESTLMQFVLAASRQAAYSDSIAAIQAFRAASDDDYDRILQADAEAAACKSETEIEFTRRLGKKLAEESLRLFDCPIVERLLNDIINDITPGTYPIVQAVLMHHTGATEIEMYCSQQFGIINMILVSAIKNVTIKGNVDPQKIAYTLVPQASLDYTIIKQLDFSDMQAFMPETEASSSFVRNGSMLMSLN